MKKTASRFTGLQYPAGDFQLVLMDDPKPLAPLLKEGNCLLVSTASQPSHGKEYETVLLDREDALLAHLRSAEVVWTDKKNWQHYRKHFLNSNAAVVVVSESGVKRAPLIVRPDTEALHALHVLLRRHPSFRLALRKLIGGLPRKEPIQGAWLIDGPFDSSYSLAIVNREMGRALKALGQQIVWSDPELLSRSVKKDFMAHTELEYVQKHPEIPVVHLRNNYPPSVDDMGGIVNLYLNYAWEETGFPQEWIEGFNQKLHGMTLVSTFVRDVLRNNGLNVPVVVTGNGIDHLEKASDAPPPLDTSSNIFTFVHISSCFPRKGVDVLLQAWGAAFTAEDPVKLVIKTFHNPHNDVPQQLKALRHQYPHHAPIELIMEDWPEQKVRMLLQSADALVAPSRAEGFGMPLAEAMYYGIPVIATGWGGHMDFCDEETAWLVDYHFTPARSHVSISESVWAEPDSAHLAAQMREIAHMPSQDRQKKTDIAKERIAERYRWQRLAEQTENFVQTIWSAPAFWPEPKVLWISTFNSRCGIAEYSRNLLKAFPSGQYSILADMHSEPIEEDPPYVQRLLTWTDQDIETIVEAASAYDAVVLQHHHALYALSTVALLIERLKHLGKQVYITFHNTHAPHTGPGFEAEGLRQADRLFVHGVADLNRLKQYGLVRNVALFPHGVYEHAGAADKQAALRHSLGLDGKQVIASFGFLMPHKGIEELIQAFAQLLKQHSQVRLLLLNSYHPSTPSDQQKQALDALIDKLGIADYVIRRHDYLPEEEAIAYLSLADVVAFPYRHTQESASGAVRMAVAAGRPIVTTPLPIFEDVSSIVRFTGDMSIEALADTLHNTLLEIEAHGVEQIAQPVHAWAQARGWSLLSQRLWNLLQGGLLDERLGRGQ